MPKWKSQSDHVLLSSSVTSSGSVWVCAWAASSKGTVLSVLAWFRADLRTTLIKQGKIVTGRPWLGSSVVRVLSLYTRGPGFESPVMPCANFSPATFGGSVWVCARAVSSKGTVSSVPALFQADSRTYLIKLGGNCHMSIVWLGSSVVRVVARYARGHG